MENILSGKKICILVASGFSEDIFSRIQKTLNRTGAVLKTVAPENGLVHGWHDRDWGHYFPVDIHLAEALGSDFDGLVICGGARAVEKLKGNLHTRRILRHFFEAQKPVAALTEGVELLVPCEGLSGREVGACESARAALAAAGATVVDDEPAVIDGFLLSMSAFGEDSIEIMIQHLAEDPSLQHAA